MDLRSRQGSTLLDTLIAITIIGILISLALPAVQSAREAARQTQCQNNLHQITLGVIQHEGAQKHYPTGGWGWGWIGDPDRGFGREQPGGWIYNTLPYLEQSGLHDMGKGAEEKAKQHAAVQMQETPIAIFNCPSRRQSRAYPCQGSELIHNSSPVKMAAKTDYAANGGDFPWDANAGPQSYEEGDSAEYKWNFPAGDQNLLSGICFLRSEIQVKDVTDGLSNTYLVGEKFASTGDYETGKNPSDDMSMYQGDDPDITRWGRVNVGNGNPNAKDSTCGPLQDTEKPIRVYRFGSAHPISLNMALCDGSVRRISYNIDLQVHEWLANRKDGHAAAPPSL